MNIGIVLSSPPAYSETFFKNKINFLSENGNKVYVFVDKSNNLNNDFKVVSGFSWEGKWYKRWINLFTAFLRIILSPIKSIKLYQKNKLDGFSIRKNTLSLLTSAHILSFKLDWIHFGFATVAIGRENLASILGTKMAVSIRGYDISIYPLKFPNCYQLLWKNLDKLHYISDDLFSIALKQGFNSETPHQKITPAIDTDVFEGKNDSNFRKPIKIVTVARLHWIKGLEYTLDALRILNEQGIDFEYKIIGKGDDYERLVFASHSN